MVANYIMLARLEMLFQQRFADIGKFWRWGQSKIFGPGINVNSGSDWQLAIVANANIPSLLIVSANVDAVKSPNGLRE